MGLQLAALLLSDNISQIMQLCYSHMEINCLLNSTNFHLDIFQNIMSRLTVNPLKWKLCLQSRSCLVMNSQWINFSFILYIYKFSPSEYFNVTQSAFHFANIWILNVLHQSLLRIPLKIFNKLHYTSFIIKPILLPDWGQGALTSLKHLLCLMKYISHWKKNYCYVVF